MRWRFVPLVFAGFVALSGPSSAAAPAANDAAREKPQGSSAVAVQHVAVPATGIRDEAAMVLVGTALIGLGAAVRRAA